MQSTVAARATARWHPAVNLAILLHTPRYKNSEGLTKSDDDMVNALNYNVRMSKKSKLSNEIRPLDFRSFLSITALSVMAWGVVALVYFGPA